MSMRIKLSTAAIAIAAAACGVGIAADQTEVPAGTEVKVRLDQTLNSDRHGAGTRFSATVMEPIYDDEGVVLLAADTKVNGTILTFQHDPPRLQLQFDEIEAVGADHPIQASLVEFAPRKKSEMKDEGKKIGGGAAAGAVVGGLIGGDAEDVVVGAVAGAAAGTGVALLTKDSYAFVPAGSVVQFELQRSLVLPVEREETEAASEDATAD